MAVGNQSYSCKIRNHNPAREAGLSHSQLLAAFSYDASTGVFHRRHRVGKCRPGTIAGTLEACGYVRICINYKEYKAHRLAWFYVHGVWPDGEVDHVNHHRADNRIANLRIATPAQNARHMLPQKLRSSRFKGVGWDKNRSKWTARFFHAGRQRHIGRFDSERAAAEAYNAAARQYFGEFAHLNNLAS